jgi:hypothetical protein
MNTLHDCKHGPDIWSFWVKPLNRWYNQIASEISNVLYPMVLVDIVILFLDDRADQLPSDSSVIWISPWLLVTCQETWIPGSRQPRSFVRIDQRNSFGYHHFCTTITDGTLISSQITLKHKPFCSIWIVEVEHFYLFLTNDTMYPSADPQPKHLIMLPVDPDAVVYFEKLLYVLSRKCIFMYSLRWNDTGYQILEQGSFSLPEPLLPALTFGWFYPTQLLVASDIICVLFPHQCTNTISIMISLDRKTDTSIKTVIRHEAITPLILSLPMVDKAENTKIGILMNKRQFRFLTLDMKDTPPALSFLDTCYDIHDPKSLVNGICYYDKSIILCSENHIKELAFPSW